MPKEVIRTENGEKFVEVGWSPQGYVQIGVGLEPPTVEMNVPEVMTANTFTADAEASWFADLDRDQCNQLIRNLRKARDRAYGADA